MAGRGGRWALGGRRWGGAPLPSNPALRHTPTVTKFSPNPTSTPGLYIDTTDPTSPFLPWWRFYPDFPRHNPNYYLNEPASRNPR